MSDDGPKLEELRALEIAGLGARRVRVYVPPVPHPSDGWPVLYMLDGQNVFDDEGSFAGGWFAHAALEKLARRTVHTPLIVAIDNGGEQRIDELTPWSARGKGGKADALLNALVDGLMPRIGRKLRVLPGPLGAAICGSSLGGLFALYAHLRRPDAFGGAIAMSSSFFWAGRRIFELAESEPKPWTSRIYLDCGGLEGGGRLARLTVQMGELLASRGYGRDQLKVRIDARGAHNERHWRKRLPGALRFMYRRDTGAVRPSRIEPRITR